MSNHLVLFQQVPIYHTFTLHSLDEPREWFKVTSTEARLVVDDGVSLGETRTINSGVLVFIEDKQTNEVFAIGEAQELLS